jgi:hypothetical protein
MRRPSLVVVAVIVLLGSVPAFAGSEISLLGSTGSPIKFIGTGSGGTGGLGTHNFSVNFNIVNLTAFGTGSLASGPGFYSIVNAGASVYGVSSTNGGSACTATGPCTFTLGQSAPLSFSYGSSTGGNDLLTGELSLVSLSQTGTNGVFNDQLVINFVATGGALQPAFTNNNGMVQLTIKFGTNQNLASIMSGNQYLAKVISGAVIPVPEPASLALLSCSLLGLVFVGRKKLFALTS